MDEKAMKDMMSNVGSPSHKTSGEISNLYGSGDQKPSNEFGRLIE
jgi:hypothetical protein